MKLKILIVLLLSNLIGLDCIHAQDAESLFGRFESRFSLLDSIIHLSGTIDRKANIETARLKPTIQPIDTTLVDSVINNRVDAQI
ncbi:MAG: hypothetical protein K2H57_10580, partial [Duncaniella sp.]|nr:hypothetical protein [Duncaniella sp.]